MRRYGRKILSLVVALVVVLVVTACGGKPANNPGDQDMDTGDGVVTEAMQDPEPTVEPSPEPTSETTPEPAQEATPSPTPDPFPLPESAALDFVHGLKIGWNLGNSFDAYDCTWLSDEMEYESAWCGAKATEELVKELKEAGFNTIRVPVSWHNHLSDKKNYTISPQWLDRVNEVVDYAIDQDLYVIINIHHDDREEFLYPSSQYLDQSVSYVIAIWKQLAERFKDYDEHLIFGSMNEPRLVGHANEWWIDPNSEDCKDAIACINKINQAFVDTVRASGGNNATRYLLCPGYDASPDGVLNDGFVLPTDPVDNDHRIIVSAHAYTPYNFALESPGVSEWSSSDVRDVANLVGFMNDLYKKYVSQGTPVLIDEFGARDKGGNTEARVDFASYYVSAARKRGMSCIWWDNNAFQGDGELFGLIDRAKCEWRYPEIVQGMMEALQNAETK